MTYTEFLEIIHKNQVSIQGYMRLIGASKNTYIRWKKAGELPEWRAREMRSIYGE